MERRRLEDARPRVLTLLVGEAPPTWPDDALPGEIYGGAEAPGAYLIDGGTEEIRILGVARSISVPRGTSSSDLARRVDQLASSWYREHLRTSRLADRFQMLLVLGERLSRATSIAELRAATEEQVATIVGGAEAALLASTDARLDEPSGLFLIRRNDAERRDSIAAKSTLEVFERTGAASLACVPVGGGLLLVIVERRAESWKEPEAWYRLRAVASQVAAARHRIQGS